MDGELVMLKECGTLFEEEAETKKNIKDAESDLEGKVLAKYPALSLVEIKTLVVERKWMDALAASVTGEVDHLSQALTGRVKDLAERYAVPMPAITENVDELSAKVEAHDVYVKSEFWDELRWQTSPQIVIVSSIPWLWYFLLAKVRELSDSNQRQIQIEANRHPPQAKAN
jgi:hypothetical protein